MLFSKHNVEETLHCFVFQVLFSSLTSSACLSWVFRSSSWSWRLARACAKDLWVCGTLSTPTWVGWGLRPWWSPSWCVYITTWLSPGVSTTCSLLFKTRCRMLIVPWWTMWHLWRNVDWLDKPSTIGTGEQISCCSSSLQFATTDRKSLKMVSGAIKMRDFQNGAISLRFYN